MTSGFWQEPTANRKNQQVKSNRICLIGGQIGKSRRRCCRRFLLAVTCIFRRICAKLTRSKQKNIKSSLELCKTHEIWAKNTKSLSDFSKTHRSFAGFEQNPSYFHRIEALFEQNPLDCSWIWAKTMRSRQDLAGSNHLVGKCYVSWSVRVSLGFGKKIWDWTDQIGFRRKRPAAARQSSRVGLGLVGFTRWVEPPVELDIPSRYWLLCRLDA